MSMSLFDSRLTVDNEYTHRYIIHTYSVNKNCQGNNTAIG